MHQNIRFTDTAKLCNNAESGSDWSIRSDIKAEKKRQRKEQRNYKRILLQHIKFRLSVCDHDFHTFLP